MMTLKECWVHRLSSSVVKDWTQDFVHAKQILYQLNYICIPYPLFETGFHKAQVGLETHHAVKDNCEFLIFLPMPPNFWDYRHEPPQLNK